MTIKFSPNPETVSKSYVITDDGNKNYLGVHQATALAALIMRRTMTQEDLLNLLEPDCEDEKGSIRDLIFRLRGKLGGGRESFSVTTSSRGQYNGRITLNTEVEVLRDGKF